VRGQSSFVALEEDKLAEGRRRSGRLCDILTQAHRSEDKAWDWSIVN
jgi:hypothetical protein